MPRLNFLYIFLISQVFLITSCNQECPKGSGLIVTQKRQIDSINSISLNIPANVYLSKGNPELRVETDDNLIDFIHTRMINGKLKIAANSCIQNITGLNIYISTNKLNNLSVNGHASVFCEDTFSVEKIKLKLKDHCRIILSINCKNIDIISERGVNCRLSGKTENLTITATDSVRINAENLTSLNTKIKTYGKCTIKTNTSGYLDYKISGNGSIYYQNNPILKGDKNKLSQVIKED